MLPIQLYDWGGTPCYELRCFASSSGVMQRGSETISRIELFAASGVHIKTINLNAAVATLDLSGLPTDIYFIKAQLGHSTVQQVPVKQ